jgi:hypothetical protein
MKVTNVYAVFDVVSDPGAHDRYWADLADHSDEEFYAGGEDDFEHLIDLYSVHAVGEDGKTYSYCRDFPYIRGNGEKEKALLLTERANAAGEINLAYWELNLYLTMTLEGRFNCEWEREMRERHEN